MFGDMDKMSSSKYNINRSHEKKLLSPGYFVIIICPFNHHYGVPVSKNIYTGERLGHGNQLN